MTNVQEQKRSRHAWQYYKKYDLKTIHQTLCRILLFMIGQWMMNFDIYFYLWFDNFSLHDGLCRCCLQITLVYAMNWWRNVPHMMEVKMTYLILYKCNEKARNSSSVAWNTLVVVAYSFLPILWVIVILLPYFWTKYVSDARMEFFDKCWLGWKLA
jgi:hypothetical protein